jgi:hypothetical protein
MVIAAMKAIPSTGSALGSSVSSADLEDRLITAEMIMVCGLSRFDRLAR